MEDFSADSTIVYFTNPLPLLRMPIRCRSSPYPPFTLAFPDAHSFNAALDVTKHRVMEQCEEGVRMGCALTATERCRPSWWRPLLGFPGPWNSREECEQREMAACVEESKGKCSQFCKDKCVSAFRDARVASTCSVVGVDTAMGLLSCLLMGDCGYCSSFGLFMLRGGASISYRGSALLN